MKTVIFDLDGTLADGTHRLHLLPTVDLHLTDSWTEFNKASKDDAPLQNTIDICNALGRSGYFVIILTGRSDVARAETEDWLQRHDVYHNMLQMRPHSDNRKDIIIKEEFLRNVVGLEDIVAAWDDSPEVIRHFRSLGITTYAVCGHSDTSGRKDLQSHGWEELRDTVSELLSDVKARYPGQELYCPHMRKLDELISKSE